MDIAALTKTQEDAVQYMMRPESDGAALLAFDMGLGKTRTSLMFAAARGDQVVLVCAPLATLDSWAETAKTYLPHLPVRRIENSKQGVPALADFDWRKPGVYLVGHEYWERLAWNSVLVKKRRKTDPDRFRKIDSGQWSRPGPDGTPGYLLVFDESHRSANIDSWTHRALLILRADFYLALSGTFFGDKFSGAYGATRWLWPHRTDIIPEKMSRWIALWASTVFDRYAPLKVRVVGEQDNGAFVSSLPCYIRVETNMPPAVVHAEWVDLYDEQRRIFDELDRRMVAWIEENPLVVSISPTKRVRQRQATLAMPSLVYEGNELREVYFEENAISAKTDRLVDMLKNELVGQKTLVLTDSQKYARILTYRLNREFGEGTAAEWSGKVTRKNRVTVKSDFIEGDLRIIVGVPAAMGTGTDGLQHASHHVVMMSRSDRRIDNEQAIARLNRTGQQHEVHVWYVLARATIDAGQQSRQVQAALAANKSMRRKNAK
jgi:superfamily II DNA or RNA helicase